MCVFLVALILGLVQYFYTVVLFFAAVQIVVVLRNPKMTESVSLFVLTHVSLKAK